MRSSADRLLLGVLGPSLLLVACAAPPPTTTPAPATSASATPTPEPSSSAASMTPTSQPSPGGTAFAGIDLPDPGRPWDGDTLLDEMRGSTRPGGVPDEIETPEIAAAIAALIWTVDGAAWDTLAIGGFCGTSTCTLDLAGTHLGRAGEDLWTLEIDLASGAVEPIVAEVRSLPWELVDEVDRLARSLDHEGDLDAMTLGTARWLPPPADRGRFALSYRSGGEEGSCARELLLDAVEGVVVERSESGC